MTEVAAWLSHVDYQVAVILFLVGLYILLSSQNLIKKVIGLNVMETAVFAFIVTSGMVDRHAPPLVNDTVAPLASPLPHALVLTGIVVAISVTALALILIVRVKAECGSIELDEIGELDEIRDASESGESAR